jgi:hypothetical protein
MSEAKTTQKIIATKKDLQLWQDGYDKGFADAHEKFAKLFDKKLSEILEDKDFT